MRRLVGPFDFRGDATFVRSAHVVVLIGSTPSELLESELPGACSLWANHFLLEKSHNSMQVRAFKGSRVPGTKSLKGRNDDLIGEGECHSLALG